jgi:hypothetical protein
VTKLLDKSNFGSGLSVENFDEFLQIIDVPLEFSTKYMEQYKEFFEAQTAKFMSKYDMDWHEIKDKIKVLIN